MLILKIYRSMMAAKQQYSYRMLRAFISNKTFLVVPVVTGRILFLYIKGIHHKSTEQIFITLKTNNPEPLLLRDKSFLSTALKLHKTKYKTSL